MDKITKIIILIIILIIIGNLMSKNENFATHNSHNNHNEYRHESIFTDGKGSTITVLHNGDNSSLKLVQANQTTPILLNQTTRDTFATKPPLKMTAKFVRSTNGNTVSHTINVYLANGQTIVFAKKK